MISNTEKEGSLIDITMTIKEGMVVWPGDPPVRINKVSDINFGDKLNFSSISMGLHTGTHLDAPVHYIKGGEGADKRPR